MRRNLAARIPWQTLVQLAEATQVLEEYGPRVAAALEQLQDATTDAWFASWVPGSLDPAELTDATDEEWSRLEDVTGIRRGWDAALRLSRVVDDAHI